MENMNMVEGNSNGRFKKIATITLLGLVLLLPIFFIPSPYIGLHAAKISLLTISFVLLLVMFLSSILSNGLLQLPKARYLLALIAFALISLLASVFSGSIVSSITGTVFEVYTSGIILLLTGLLFLIIFTVGSDEKIVKRSIEFFIFAAIIVALFLVLRIFMVDNLSQGIALRIPNFLSGTAIDAAVFLGAVLVTALSTINMTSLSKRNRYILVALSVFSMIFIGAVNLLPVIITVGLLALVYFVYVLSWSVSKDSEIEQKEGRKVSLLSLFVIVSSLIFIISGPALSISLSNAFKINTTEVRPNFETTMNFIGKVYSEKLILGIGPNRFNILWNLNKPAEVNLTQFWATEFNFGYGLIPTLAVTTGILGLLSILAFLFLYVSAGLKAIFSVGDNSSRHIATTTFLVSMYFWIISFVHMPSVVNLALAFIFTAFFTATLVGRGVVQMSKINIFSNPKTNFVTILAVVVFLLVSISGGYFVIERVVANSLFNQGVNLAQVGNIIDSKAKIIQAIRTAPNALYWRSLAEVSIVNFNQILVSQPQTENIDEGVATNLRILISDSIEAGRQAVQQDGGDYQNWFTLARIYEVLATNRIEGAQENAKINYLEAQKRAPNNPAIELALARVSAIGGDVAGAKVGIERSLAMKRNYTDAYFYLAQIEVASNNIKGAIQSVEAATLIDSSNPGLYFQLGLLKYNEKDYKGATPAFERAVALASDYANAKYFLGLSYSLLNREAEALKQFKDLEKTNPNNAEIKFILENLMAGRDPFANVKPPADNKPEKRIELPVEEN